MLYDIQRGMADAFHVNLPQERPRAVENPHRETYQRSLHGSMFIPPFAMLSTDFGCLGFPEY